jgi:hypothetical protein
MEYSDHLDAFVKEFGLEDEDYDSAGVPYSDALDDFPASPRAFTKTGTGS